MLKNLNHPNICKLFEFGFKKLSAVSWKACLVMEYARGQKFLDVATKIKMNLVTIGLYCHFFFPCLNFQKINYIGR
jgi:serine/threonine protein kinase